MITAMLQVNNLTKLLIVRIPMVNRLTVEIFNG